jgi:hypothetical protein
MKWSPSSRLLALDYQGEGWNWEYKDITLYDPYTARGPNYEERAIESGWLYVFDLENSAWRESCFWRDGNVAYGFGLRSYPYWTPDERFLWWLEERVEFTTNRPPSDEGIRPNYGLDLVVADLETGAYGILAENVGWLSSLVIVEE